MSEFVFLHRETIVNYSKIGSYHTYYSALRNLQEWGYLECLPKQNGENSTKIKLIFFEYSEADFTILDEIYDAYLHRSDAEMLSNEENMHAEMHQVDAYLQTLSADMLPFFTYMHQGGCKSASHYKVLKYLNVIKSFIKYKKGNFSNSQNSIQNPQDFLINFEEEKKRKKVASKKENDFLDFPSENETVIFFELHNSNSENAQKFYNYYSAIGWVTKSNIPIVDWESAAKTWISNERVQTANSKTDYDEAF
jgi:hypothetical protein